MSHSNNPTGSTTRNTNIVSGSSNQTQQPLQSTSTVSSEAQWVNPPSNTSILGFNAFNTATTTVSSNTGTSFGTTGLGYGARPPQTQNIRPQQPIPQNNQGNQGYIQDGQLVQILQQMTNALQTMTGNNNNGGNVPVQANRAELNLVKPNYFHGLDDEDPFEWIASFNRAATANQWNDNRKIAIAAGYLRDAATKWYDEN